jgi:hypothetical protein
MSNQIQEINISELETYKLCQLIDLAGFKTIIGKSYIRLEDKKNTNADKYSDLTFRTIVEAARAIQPYIVNQFKIVA